MPVQVFGSQRVVCWVLRLTALSVDDTTIIEVKCHFSARETPLHELAVQPKGFFLCVPATGEDSKQLVLNSANDTGMKYYHQIQGNLYFTGRSVCDLIVWTPSEMHIIPVAGDVAWEDNVGKLENCYKQHFQQTFLAGGD